MSSDLLSNEELVDSYNTRAEKYNSDHAEQIDVDELTIKSFSSAGFIEKASDIKSHHVYSKEGHS